MPLIMVDNAILSFIGWLAVLIVFARELLISFGLVILNTAKKNIVQCIKDSMLDSIKAAHEKNEYNYNFSNSNSAKAKRSYVLFSVVVATCILAFAGYPIIGLVLLVLDRVLCFSILRMSDNLYEITKNAIEKLETKKEMNL
jgi:hypothetical protein